MTIAETIYQHSLHLPEAAAQQALDFIEFLEKRYGVNNNQSVIVAAHKRQAGSAKGKLIIIEDDDSHLADFKEYMP